jgi:hypothetical protein
MDKEDIINKVRRKFERLSGVLDERGAGYGQPQRLKPLAMAGRVSLPKPPVYHG